MYVQQLLHAVHASVRIASAEHLHELQTIAVQLQLLRAAIFILRLAAYDNSRWQKLYATVLIAAVCIHSDGCSCKVTVAQMMFTEMIVT
jgi:hypothetical protein